ncbi:MAG: hypothetical protein JRM80_02325 [Nitrososphaerota archaeon]|nr:hypothetical protein [Nitrososphaerota archaeon]
MVVSADPITGASEEIGTYAVRVAANDVATSGNAAQFLESVVLLPDGSTSSKLEEIARQMHGAARDSGIAILGGHTEVTPGLRAPVIVATVFSFVDGFVTSAGAKEGDVLMMTKTAGLEGTSELAREHRFPKGSVPSPVIGRARRYIDQIDVTAEAVAAYRTGKVHAMHDCTEGGVTGAAYEMSLASKLGFTLRSSEVPVSSETTKICSHLSIDPLRLIGSGSLLLAVEEGAEDAVERALHPTMVTTIGEFHRGRRLVDSRGGFLELKEAPEDELWRVLGGPSRRRHRL